MRDQEIIGLWEAYQQVHAQPQEEVEVVDDAPEKVEESVDLFDYLLEYLVAEGYADTNKAALVIMANMSEEWKQSIVEGVRPGDVETPLDKAAFKKRRRSLAGREASADARSRGHVDRFTGKPYGTEEAASRRKDIHTDRYSPERAARHRANVDPDFEGNDERNYPGGKLKNPKKIRKAKAEEDPD